VDHEAHSRRRGAARARGGVLALAGLLTAWRAPSWPAVACVGLAAAWHVRQWSTPVSRPDDAGTEATRARPAGMLGADARALVWLNAATAVILVLRALLGSGWV
jgi:hypothetical protein